MVTEGQEELVQGVVKWEPPRHVPSAPRQRAQSRDGAAFPPHSQVPAASRCSFVGCGISQKGRGGTRHLLL